jgi:hypothetical protein
MVGTTANPDRPLSNPDFAGDAPVDFDAWFDHTFRRPDGNLYGVRARQGFVKRFKLPIIRMGWARLIVPSVANARIAELALYQTEEPVRRGRGRPRAA